MVSPSVSSSSFISLNCRATSFSKSQRTTCFLERGLPALDYKIHQQVIDTTQSLPTLKRQKVTVFYMYGVVFQHDKLHILKMLVEES